MGVADLCGERVRPEISPASLYRTHDAGSEFKKNRRTKLDDLAIFESAPEGRGV
jgi:hypothetical protein